MISVIERALKSVHGLTSPHSDYAVLSHGTIVLYTEVGTVDHVQYECPSVHARSFNQPLVQDLACGHPYVYSALAHRGFPWRGVSERSSTLVTRGLYLVEWPGGQIVHIVDAYTATSASALAINAYVNDYLSPAVVRSGKLNQPIPMSP